MKNKIKKFIENLKETIKNDPVHNCHVYLNTGCSHVDGILCNYPKCDMIPKEFKNGTMSNM